MAETPDSVPVTEPPTSNSDPFPGAACTQDSSMDFWYHLYSSNQAESQLVESINLNVSLDKSEPGPSRRDYEWGHVLDKSTKMKRKKKNMDVSSSMNSASDLSEALSAVSAALSLSSSSYGSSETDQDDEEVPELLREDIFHDKVATNERRKDEFRTPEIGMEFSSEAEAYEVYKNYANKIGFSVRKGKVQRLSDRTIRKKYFFCSKQGFRCKKQYNKITKYKRKETRTGCEAKIQFTLENGKWVISQFSHAHNHQLRHVEASSTNTYEDRLMIPTKSDDGQNTFTMEKHRLSKEVDREYLKRHYETLYETMAEESKVLSKELQELTMRVDAMIQFCLGYQTKITR